MNFDNLFYRISISLEENNESKTSNDKQPRSPAITIIRSNNRQAAPPQVEPFYRPKPPGPLPNAQASSEPYNNDFVSHSLPTNTESDAAVSSKSKLVKDNGGSQKRSKNSKESPEEPRTPHSRAKNIARFYPVTKDALVVKADVICNLNS